LQTLKATKNRLKPQWEAGGALAPKKNWELAVKQISSAAGIGWGAAWMPSKGMESKILAKTLRKGEAKCYL